MLNPRTQSILFGVAILTACPAAALPKLGSETVEPVAFSTAPIEAEPVRELPPILAAPLPELAPTRPLAHLAPLWRHIESSGAAPTTYAALGETALAMSPSDALTLGLPASSFDLARIEATRLSPIAWAGPMLVLGSGSSFAGALASSELTWITPGATTSYAHAISPRMLLASLYGGQEDRLIAWALADGREQWQRLGKDEFTRIRSLWSEGERAYLLGDRGLVVFDPNTGATLWTSDLAKGGCGVASEGERVVIEDPSGHHILDARTGDPIARLPPLANSSSCGWDSYADEGLAAATIRAGTLFVFDLPDAADEPTLRALELATQTLRWTATGFDAAALVADHDAVYVAEGRSVIALAAATGKPQASVSIGSDFSLRVEPVGGPAGPLVVVHEEWGEWVLGRAELAPTLEEFVITGRLSATGGLDPKRIAGVRLRIGDQIVVTDKRGRFSAKGKAIGAITVESAADPYGGYDYDDEGYPPILITEQRVELAGKGRYELGSIEAYEASIG